MHGSARTASVDLLQNLGLKEYEARSFVALTRISTGTAKEIAEISEVPRTRVYDAIDVLEAEGLVEVQQGTPKRFRAVDIEAATRVLRRQHDEQIDSLGRQLRELESPDDAEDTERQEVWSLTGQPTVQTRTEAVVAEAESEIVLLVVDDALLTDELCDRLRAAHERGVAVIVGTGAAASTEHVSDRVPFARLFESDLGWLMAPEADDEVAISRLLLTDRETLLVGSVYPEGDDHPEQAVFANGLDNGVVVLLRRLISSGLLPARDPVE